MDQPDPKRSRHDDPGDPGASSSGLAPVPVPILPIPTSDDDAGTSSTTPVVEDPKDKKEEPDSEYLVFFTSCIEETVQVVQNLNATGT